MVSVPFGAVADIAVCLRDVRFTPKTDVPTGERHVALAILVEMLAF